MIKRILTAPFIWLAALILALEEWMWEPILKWLRGLAKWRAFQRLEAWAAKRSPYTALILFMVPVLLLLPFKFLGFYLIAHGMKAIGVATFVSAKVVGTGLVAWIYALTEPALSKLAWFVSARGKFVTFKAHVYSLVKSSILWRFTRLKLSSFKARLLR